MRFVGRTEELQLLKELLLDPLSVATITGRRRIGKSRLVAEHAARIGRQLVKIEGRNGPQAGNALQLAAFAQDLGEAVGTTGLSFQNWNSAFNTLGALAQGKQWIILLDEITWLARHSEECLAELKVFIDRHLNGSGNQLIICGSVSQWIEQHINESDLFVGRISCMLNLRPLSLVESAQFWSPHDIPPREILTVLCVTGGIPRYLEQIDPRESAEWNIHRLCFRRAGYLANELPTLIKNSFLPATRESSLERYLKTLAALSGKGMTPAEIQAATGIQNNDRLAGNLAALSLSGLVSENPVWNIETGEIHPRNVRYRIEDPYARFYLKYIAPQLKSINQGQYDNITLKQLPSWDTVRGLQFEVLVAQNMFPAILEKLNLRGVPVQRFGPYFQKKAVRRAPTQIDYLLQADDTLYVCETKFRKLIDGSVIDEVKEKVRRLGLSKETTVRKVLIYSGELEPVVKGSLYFDRQICVDELLG